MAIIGYSGAWGKLIREKRPKDLVSDSLLYSCCGTHNRLFSNFAAIYRDYAILGFLFLRRLHGEKRRLVLHKQLCDISVEKRTAKKNHCYVMQSL